MTIAYTYQSILKDALKINWRVEDLIGGDKQLDFSKPFLPESMVCTQEITCLNTWEKLLLNQIRGNSYLYLFFLFEQYVIPMILDQISKKGFADLYALQALLCFAEEESKHVRLFQQFAVEFQRGFGSPCRTLGQVSIITQTILNHHPLSVLLFTLQLEWTTQSHYLESIRGNHDENLESRFCDLLKHHWLEEAQHTKLDTLLINELAQKMDAIALEAAIADYLALTRLLDTLLTQQMHLDIISLKEALDRTFSDREIQEITAIQQQAYRWSFLCTGVTHPNFISVLQQISPSGKARITQMAKDWS
jgi:hypothetical protein